MEFVSTKFFLALQKASQTGIDVDADVLKNGYNEFVKLVFTKDTTVSDRTVYRQTLLCTRVELSSLALTSEKKCGNLS